MFLPTYGLSTVVASEGGIQYHTFEKGDSTWLCAMVRNSKRVVPNPFLWDMCCSMVVFPNMARAIVVDCPPGPFPDGCSPKELSKKGTPCRVGYELNAIDVSGATPLNPYFAAWAESVSFSEQVSSLISILGCSQVTKMWTAEYPCPRSSFSCKIKGKKIDIVCVTCDPSGCVHVGDVSKWSHSLLLRCDVLLVWSSSSTSRLRGMYAIPKEELKAMRVFPGYGYRGKLLITFPYGNDLQDNSLERFFVEATDLTRLTPLLLSYTLANP